MLEPVAVAEPVLRLEDDVHKAFLGEREIVRATSAFKAVGLVDPTWFTPEGAERGIIIHDAVLAFHDARAFSVPAHVRPYWNGFLRFVEETGMGFWRVEEPVYSATPGFEYAGRYDIFGRLGHRWASDYDDLIDVKTGSCPKTVIWQTAGYGRCMLTPPMRLRRWAVVLPGDESYTLVPLNLTPDGRRVDVQLQRRHEQDFLSIVRVANLKLGFARG